MTHFDTTDRPLWSLVGDAYLRLLEPLRVNSTAPIADRPQYVKTLRQISARPTRTDLESQAYALTRAMPALAVHIRESRVESRTTQSLDKKLDVDVHCFCGGMGRGDELRDDHMDGIRWLTQDVTEFLEARIPPVGDDVELDGIEVQSTEHIITNERVDWWVVRTDVMVRHWIHRQRTEQAAGIEVQQFGLGKRDEPLATTVLDFETASTLAQEHNEPEE